MRKLSFSLVLVLTLLCTCVPVHATYTPGFEISAKAAYLVNLNTGEVIYEKNADQRMYPASTTKIMTSVLAFEMCDDLKGTVVKARGYLYDEFYGKNVSTGDIRRGEEMTMENLIYAMMLASANEGASIVADYLGDGSIAHFADLMTQRAKELGCTGTNFVNPHGLFDEHQYTTAKDLFLIAKHAYDIPGFMEIATTTQRDVEPTNKHDTLTWYTTNKMMLKSSDYYYAPIRGMKTGTLDESGKCFVSTATLDGYDYMCVILGAPIVYNDDGKEVGNAAFEDTKRLYQWAFSTFSVKTLVERGTDMTEIPLRLANDIDHVKLESVERFTALMPDDIEASSLVMEFNVPESVTAPIKKGEPIGEVHLMLAGREIGVVPLAAASSIERSEILYWLDQFENWTLTFWFKFTILLVAAFVVSYTVLMVKRNKGRHRSHMGRSGRR